MNKKVALIVSGGMLEEAFASKEIEQISWDILIGVDHGNQFLYQHQIRPTHVVGDFDSLDPEIVRFYKETPEIFVREFNPVKDATDTEIAVRLAMELAADEIVILGATGTRLDHVLGNIQLLKLMLDQGISGVIMDFHNRMQLIISGYRLKKANQYGEYFSLFSLWGEVPGLCITGAKYPLSNHLLKAEDGLCVSNEVTKEEAVITFEGERLLLIETRD